MAHYSPIIFDFHKLIIAIHSEAEEIILQGCVVEAELNLLRNKDLRNFINYKHSCYSISQGTNPDAESPIEVKELLGKYKDVFTAPTGLPPERSLDHAISLKSDAQAFKIKPYRYPHSQKTEIERQVMEMLDSGIIKHSNNPYASPVLLVKKKDGTWRFCVDYRHLNKLTIKDKYPIPNVEELIAELCGSKYHSKIDLRQGIIRLELKSKMCTKLLFKLMRGIINF